MLTTGSPTRQASRRAFFHATGLLVKKHGLGRARQTRSISRTQAWKSSLRGPQVCPRLCPGGLHEPDDISASWLKLKMKTAKTLVALISVLVKMKHWFCDLCCDNCSFNHSFASFRCRKKPAVMLIAGSGMTWLSCSKMPS